MRARDLTLLFGVLFLLSAIVVRLFGEDFSPNTQLFLLINGAQSSAVNPIMVAISNYGDYFWIPVNFLVWLLGRGEQRRVAYLLAASFILGIALGMASKLIINAPRPALILPTANVLIGGEADPSFPSSHALIVSVGAILSLARLPRRIAWPLTLEAVLVSYSRVYVGVHWPIDILGGWLLGGFSVFIVLFLSSRLGIYPPQSSPSSA